MRVAIVLLLCLGLVGCATFQLSDLEKKGSDYAMTEVVNSTKKDVFDVLPEAIRRGSDSTLIIRYSNYDEGKVYAQNSYLKTMGTAALFGSIGASKIMFGVFLLGDNPTEIKIMQWTSGSGMKDYKYRVMQEIKSKL